VARDASPASLFAAIGATRDESLFDATWNDIARRLTSVHHFPLSTDDLAAVKHVLTAFAEAGPDISYAYHLGSPPNATQWLVTYADLQTATNADSVGMSFLASEAQYAWLRAFEEKNLLVPLVADFAGPRTIRAVGDYVRQRRGTVTAFYTSNVEQYLFG